MMFLRLLLTTIFALFTLTAAFADAVEITESRLNDEHLVAVSNGYFRAEFTTLGGRIRSLSDKKRKKELVSWAPGGGGLFDDRDVRTMAEYSYRLLSHDPEKAVLEYRLVDAVGLRWRKLITVRSKYPVISVDYTISNETDRTIPFEQMVRNFIVPTKDLFFCYHSPGGPQEIKWGDWARASGDKDVWFNEVCTDTEGGGWAALLDRDSGSGLVAVSNPLSRLYCWTDGKRGTLEWMYPAVTLKPGESYSASTSLIVTNGMSDIDSATGDYLLSLAYVEQGKEFRLRNTLQGISDRFSGHLLLRSKLLDINRRQLAEFDLNLPLSKVDKGVMDVEQTWQAPGDGIYILQQAVYAGDIRLGFCEMPLMAGFIDENMVYRHPSWQPKQEKVLFKMTSDDVKRGYFMHLPAEKSERESIDALRIDLGMGEYEHLEVDIHSFMDMANAEVTLLPLDFPGTAELLIEDDYRLRPQKKLNIKAGQRNTLWLRLNTAGVDKGTYNLRLLVQPEGRKPAALNVEICVWPISLPEQEDLYVNFFWSSFEALFWTREGRRALYSDVSDRREQLRLWRECLKDLKMAGQRIMEIYPDLYGANNSYIRVKEYKDSYLPVLDFSEWDPILRIAVEEGMKHAVFRYHWYNRNWLPPGYESMPPKRQEEILDYLLLQVYGRLKDYGFDRIFFYFIDELEPSPEEVKKVCERMERLKRVCPGLEFAGSGFAVTPKEQMQQMSDHLTWIAPYWAIYSIFGWIEDGSLQLRPNTIVASQISGGFKGGYRNTRLNAWRYWRGGLTGYQIYGYYQGKHRDAAYSCVFFGKERPVASPVLFGLIDGWEDFQYLHRLKRLLSELRLKGHDVSAVEAVLNRLIGGDNALLEWRHISSTSFTYPIVVGDIIALRDAKKQVLEALSALENLK